MRDSGKKTARVNEWRCKGIRDRLQGRRKGHNNIELVMRKRDRERRSTLQSSRCTDFPEVLPTDLPGDMHDAPSSTPSTKRKDNSLLCTYIARDPTFA